MILNTNIKPFLFRINNNLQELEAINLKIENFGPHSPRFAEILYLSILVKEQIYHDIDDVTSVIFCTPEVAKKICIVNEYYGYNFTLKEATDLLFTNQLNLEKADKTFKNIINQWIYSNYDANDVFDKKLEGHELTEADLLILKNS